MSFPKGLLKYTPPSWAKSLKFIPTHKFSLANTPTPIEKWEKLPNKRPSNVWLKRDDLTGVLLSGNKIRKLEFSLAEAVQRKADCVITIGGVQSNHCRATAIACRSLGLEPYLLLRHSNSDKLEHPLEGNLMLSRLVGAHIRLFTVQQIAQCGGYSAIVDKLYTQLKSEGKNPYVIPMGASNAVGTWGYISFVDELLSQLKDHKLHIDDIIFAAGSGGTAAGIGLGLKLSDSRIKCHAVAVCDDKEYFHREINSIFKELGAPYEASELVNVIEGYKGIGYGKATPEELNLMLKISSSTGIILDPTYTNKAACAMIKESDLFENRNVLFIHTGGLFSLFSFASQMEGLVHGISDIRPLF